MLYLVQRLADAAALRIAIWPKCHRDLDVLQRAQVAESLQLDTRTDAFQAQAWRMDTW
ncbi:hypothetical protein V8C26DRAFT_410283 [Trichoderma gracile]